MNRKKILLIGGSLNQTTIAHAVARRLEPTFECFFSAFYCDGLLEIAARAGLLDFSIIGGKFRAATEAYFQHNNLKVDYGGKNNHYDLVIILSDLIIPRNLHGKKIILIQEGMTDPENVLTFIVRQFGLPRWLAGNTSTHGLSGVFDRFCVASDGYRDFFIKKGVDPEKIFVTGIPNFDNAAQFLENDFPHRDYVLVATSDLRETFRFDNRKRFIRKCKEIANSRPLIFKLHPNEKVDRARREIIKEIPDALVFSDGNTNHMIANCDVLITQYSSVVYIGLALGKIVYSNFCLKELERLAPIQNDGASSKNIAQVCIDLLENS